jgi:hypothetical protein
VFQSYMVVGMGAMAGKQPNFSNRLKLHGRNIQSIDLKETIVQLCSRNWIPPSLRRMLLSRWFTS